MQYPGAAFPAMSPAPTLFNPGVITSLKGGSASLALTPPAAPEGSAYTLAALRWCVWVDPGVTVNATVWYGPAAGNVGSGVNTVHPTASSCSDLPLTYLPAAPAPDGAFTLEVQNPSSTLFIRLGTVTATWRPL